MDHLIRFRQIIAELTGLKVYIDLAHDFELKSLPAVNLTAVGPPGRMPYMQGLGLDIQDIDVELYISEDSYLQGEMGPQARALRHLIYQITDPAFRVLDVSSPLKRPDRNPSVRRIDLVATVAVPA